MTYLLRENDESRASDLEDEWFLWPCKTATNPSAYRFACTGLIFAGEAVVVRRRLRNGMVASWRILSLKGILSPHTNSTVRHPTL
jgi:hypothetical protein